MEQGQVPGLQRVWPGEFPVPAPPVRLLDRSPRLVSGWLRPSRNIRPHGPAWGNPGKARQADRPVRIQPPGTKTRLRPEEPATAPDSTRSPPIGTPTGIVGSREEKSALKSPSGRIEATGGRCYRPGMVDAAFDTLAVTRQFKARGFSSDQAEAITEAVRAGVTGGVATKADLADLKTDMAVATKADLADLKTDMAGLEARLTLRIIIIGLALNAASAAAVIAAVGWVLSGS